MGKGLRHRFGEGSVAVVDVDVIVFLKIVGDVDVRAAVEIEITDYYAETIGLEPAVDVSVLAHVDEMVSIIPVEPVACLGVPHGALR